MAVKIKGVWSEERGVTVLRNLVNRYGAFAHLWGEAFDPSCLDIPQYLCCGRKSKASKTRTRPKGYTVGGVTKAKKESRTKKETLSSFIRR